MMFPQRPYCSVTFQYLTYLRKSSVVFYKLGWSLKLMCFFFTHLKMWKKKEFMLINPCLYSGSPFLTAKDYSSALSISLLFLMCSSVSGEGLRCPWLHWKPCVISSTSCCDARKGSILWWGAAGSKPRCYLIKDYLEHFIKHFPWYEALGTWFVSLPRKLSWFICKYGLPTSDNKKNCTFCPHYASAFQPFQ